MPTNAHQPPRKHYVAGPDGRAPTHEEALAMGRALFDAIIEPTTSLTEALMTGSGTSTCKFCGGAGPLTKEHVLRKKWRTYYGSTPVPLLDAHTYQQSDGSLIQHRSEYTHRPFDREVRCVCQDCNGGWMNDLEKTAESTLVRLIEGQAGFVEPTDIRTLNRWVAKTAFVMEEMDPDCNATSLDQLTAVREGRDIPRFHAFMLPVEPNVTYRTRSTPYCRNDDPSRAALRFSSIHFYQIMFFAITAQDDEAAALLDVSNFEELLGRPLTTMVEGVQWPDRPPWPVDLLQRLHDRVAGIDLHSDPEAWEEIPQDQP